MLLIEINDHLIYKTLTSSKMKHAKETENCEHKLKLSNYCYGN